MHPKDNEACLQHSVTIKNESDEVVEVLHFDGKMFSLRCANNGFTYRATNGTLFDTKLHTITPHLESDPLGNVHYVATRVMEPVSDDPRNNGLCFDNTGGMTGTGNSTGKGVPLPYGTGGGLPATVTCGTFAPRVTTALGYRYPPSPQASSYAMWSNHGENCPGGCYTSRDDDPMSTDAKHQCIYYDPNRHMPISPPLRSDLQGPDPLSTFDWMIEYDLRDLSYQCLCFDNKKARGKQYKCGSYTGTPSPNAGGYAMWSSNGSGCIRGISTTDPDWNHPSKNINDAGKIRCTYYTEGGPVPGGSEMAYPWMKEAPPTPAPSPPTPPIPGFCYDNPDGLGSQKQCGYWNGESANDGWSNGYAMYSLSGEMCINNSSTNNWSDKWSGADRHSFKSRCVYYNTKGGGTDTSPRGPAATQCPQSPEKTCQWMKVVVPTPAPPPPPTPPPTPSFNGKCKAMAGQPDFNCGPGGNNKCCDHGSGKAQICYNSQTQDCCTTEYSKGYVCPKGKCSTKSGLICD